jgi:hypothetical protein
MVFAMNLAPPSDGDLSVVAADAEDAAHRHYPLPVESIQRVPGYDWLSEVIFKLNDDLVNVGDVLIGVAYHGENSNRVRIAIGHAGGGPADDPGSLPTPAPPYTISGQLTGDGEGLRGISLTLSGAETGTVVTGDNGRYSFTVNKVGDYFLTPAGNPFYDFPAQAFSNLHHNQVADFAGTLRYYTVAGMVQNGPYPSNDIEVAISGSQTASTKTDDVGNYSFVLPAKGNYTITPSSPYYDFIPINTTITALDADISRTFYSARRLFTVSGKLVDQQGNGLSGLAVNLFLINQPADPVHATVTDSAGRYQFTNLKSGYDYVLTPPSTPDFTFTGKTIVDLISNQTLDFTGLRRLTLNGRIRDQSGNGLIGIIVTMSGSESSASVTGPDGRYSFKATATGNYAVTPSIPQDFYTFAPTSGQFNNLAAAQTTDFIATFAPLPNPSHVLEFDGSQKSVDYGPFWQEGVNLGHFFWEFWAMPGGNAGATYMLSDGYGGAHALLFGVGSFNSSEPERYELLGNIFDGVKHDNYFGSDVGPAVGEWAHFGVGWDGQSIITYYNGVPVGKTPFSGPRRTPGPGAGGGRLLIGGSDHSNFDGRIAEVRGYENRNPREDLPGGIEAAFAPQTVFGLEGNLLSYYFRSAPVVADLSHGYNGVAHLGVPRSTAAGVIFACSGCPPPAFVLDPSAPNFATGSPPSPVSVPPAPSSPRGALIFDSFSRVNSTYTFGGHGGLGSTEGGSAGVQVWQTNVAPLTPQPFGILNTRAVLLANTTAVAWIPTGSPIGNVDVRVNRYTGRWGSGVHTGLSFRVLDANNFFFAYTADNQESAGSRSVHVGYYLNGQRVDLTTNAPMPSNWTTLRVTTTNSGDLKVYLDSTLVYSTNNPWLASATGAGLYSNSAGMGLVNRWDNFTVFEAP